MATTSAPTLTATATSSEPMDPAALYWSGPLRWRRVRAHQLAEELDRVCLRDGEQRGARDGHTLIRPGGSGRDSPAS